MLTFLLNKLLYLKKIVLNVGQIYVVKYVWRMYLSYMLETILIKENSLGPNIEDMLRDTKETTVYEMP